LCAGSTDDAIHIKKEEGPSYQELNELKHELELRLEEELANNDEMYASTDS
jgi:hypothetical protein